MFKRLTQLVSAFLILIVAVGGVTLYMQNPNPEVYAKLNVPVLDDSMVTPESLGAAVDASNIFAFDLYARYSAGEDNLFYSPYSISTALSMTYEGARGQTAEEMRSVFHWDEDDLARRSGAARVFNLLNAGDRPYTLQTANALWMQVGYPFKEDYVTVIKDSYGGEANSIDFAKLTKAVETINGWIEERTNDKIKDMFDESSLRDARLVLTNAIYFKGDWATQFDAEQTRNGVFHVALDSTVEVDMMRLWDEDFNYTENAEAQVLELPYSGGDLSMIIVLPKGNDIHEVEDTLTAAKLREWLSDLRPTAMDVNLPKFKLETKYDMGEDLAAMGMPTAFTGGADFSGMSDSGLFISKVIHQAYVDVNEEGTEAAAATGVVMLESAPMTTLFNADHPFTFLIQNRETGLILFMGRVMDPS
ncbi:MAG TPA: serpin family protein [Patescibacteria group bacterium]|nr:serpin family protein [Patescibacteria group bacterium]